MSNEEKLDELLALSGEAASFGLVTRDSTRYAELREEILSVLNEVTE